MNETGAQMLSLSLSLSLSRSTITPINPLCIMSQIQLTRMAQLDEIGTTSSQLLQVIADNASSRSSTPKTI